MRESGHVVVTYGDYRTAIQDSDYYDLYVVGNLNGVDGPDFALQKVMEGKRVLILSEVQKLSKIAFVPLDTLSNRALLNIKVEEITTGGN